MKHIKTLIRIRIFCRNLRYNNNTSEDTCYIQNGTTRLMLNRVSLKFVIGGDVLLWTVK